MKTLISKRPSERTPEIMEAAVDMLMPTVWDWVIESSSAGSCSSDEREMVRLKLIKAVKNSTRDFDGYDLAKTIEQQFMWDVDASLVEILDSYSHLLYKAHRNAVKAWVIENNIIPQRDVGDDIMVIVFQVGYHGRIVHVDTETAQYSVNIPALGHAEHEFSTIGGKKVAKSKGNGSLSVIKPVEEIDD